jgi:hypothetical protein
MFKFIHSFMAVFQQIDPRIYELEKEIDLYRIILAGGVLLLIILVLIVVLQWASLKKMRRGADTGVPADFTPGKKSPAKTEKGKTEIAASPSVKGRDLPDPGLVYKFSLADEKVTEKLITIGQTEGNIKTFSTEVINDHFSINIRIIENQRDRDIYNLPDKIYEEYILDMRRDGRVLVYFPGLEGYRQMGARERVYIKQEPDSAGDPTFHVIEAKQPIRLRIGDRLNQDEKFANGYFEFHLYTQEYEVKTSAGIPKIEKNFMVRLYRIYPGYDMSSPSPDGLYPMTDPFRAG